MKIEKEDIVFLFGVFRTCTHNPFCFFADEFYSRNLEYHLSSN